MYFLGLFVSNAFTDPADLADLDFFPYPSFGNTYDAEKALDAPDRRVHDHAKSPSLAQNLHSAKAYLEFFVDPVSPRACLRQEPGLIPAANVADPSTFSVLQKKAAEIVGAHGGSPSSSTATPDPTSPGRTVCNNSC